MDLSLKSLRNRLGGAQLRPRVQRRALLIEMRIKGGKKEQEISRFEEEEGKD